MSSINFDDIELCEKIGEGNFGAVYRGDYLGTQVAVKEIFALKGWDYKKYMDREWSIMKEARHPNVVQYMGAVTKEAKFYIVTEFVPGGNLKNWILQTPLENQTLRFATDIARALAYLHAHSIIHRDLKGENLLITENYRLKVCDFGFSRTISDDESKRLSYCGTDAYMAPEIILCMPFDARIDIFSFGIVLCELIICQIATESNLPREIPGFGISREVLTKHVIPGTPEDLVDLALDCTKSDADERPNWKEIMKRISSIESNLDVSTNIGLLKRSDQRIFGGGDETPNSVDTNYTPLTSTNVSPSKDEKSGVVTEKSEPEQPEDQLVTSLPGSPGMGRKRMGHNIPHRFSYVSSMNESLSKCIYCKRMIGLSKHFHCDDCGCVAHKSCGGKVPPHCGFSAALQEASFSNLNK